MSVPYPPVVLRLSTERYHASGDMLHQCTLGQLMQSHMHLRTPLCQNLSVSWVFRASYVWDPAACDRAERAAMWAMCYRHRNSDTRAIAQYEVRSIMEDTLWPSKATTAFLWTGVSNHT